MIITSTKNNSLTPEGGYGIISTKPVDLSITEPLEVKLQDEIHEVLKDSLVESRVISHILNEGLNTKEDLDMIRHDIIDEGGMNNGNY